MILTYLTSVILVNVYCYYILIGLRHLWVGADEGVIDDVITLIN